MRFLGAICSKSHSRSGSSRRSGLQRPAGFHPCRLPCPPQISSTKRTMESFNQPIIRCHNPPPRQILIWKCLEAVRQVQPKLLPKLLPRQGKTNELRLIQIDVFISTIFADVDTCDMFNLKVEYDIWNSLLSLRFYLTKKLIFKGGPFLAGPCSHCRFGG